jgi:hypothetical protein
MSRALPGIKRRRSATIGENIVEGRRAAPVFVMGRRGAQPCHRFIEPADSHRLIGTLPEMDHFELLTLDQHALLVKSKEKRRQKGSTFCERC